jgi:hypothetical protein
VNDVVTVVAPREVLPVTARALAPIVAPPNARDVPVATPRVGVVRNMLEADRLLGRVVEIDGTPVPLVTRTPSLVVESPLRVVPALA